MARGSFRSPLAPDSSGRSRGDPDDPYDPYAPRAARRRRRPEEPTPIERALTGLVADPLYWQDQDEDYFQYVRRQYAQVYGSGKVQRDATGRQRETAPKPEYAEGRRGLDWFAPEPKPQDLHPRGPVGRSVSTGGAAPQAAGSRRPGNAPVNTPGNARRDVVGLQKALAGTGWYHWQPPHEPSGQVTEALDAAIRAFQQAHGLMVDGLVTPDGPTLRSLAQAAGLPLQAPERDADTPPEPEPTPEPHPTPEPTPNPPAPPEEPGTPEQPDAPGSGGVKPKPPGDQHPDGPDRAAKCRALRHELRVREGEYETALEKKKGLPELLDKAQKEVTRLEQELERLWQAYRRTQAALGALELAIDLGLWLLSRHPYGRLAVVVGRGVEALQRRKQSEKEEPFRPQPGPSSTYLDPDIAETSAALEAWQQRRRELTEQIEELNAAIAEALAAMEELKREIARHCGGDPVA